MPVFFFFNFALKETNSMPTPTTNIFGFHMEFLKKKILVPLDKMWPKKPVRVKSNRSTLPSGNAFVNFPLTTVFSYDFFFALFFVSIHELTPLFLLPARFYCRRRRIFLLFRIQILFICHRQRSQRSSDFLWMRCRVRVCVEFVCNEICLIYIVIWFRFGLETEYEQLSMSTGNTNTLVVAYECCDALHENRLETLGRIQHTNW